LGFTLPLPRFTREKIFSPYCARNAEREFSSDRFTFGGNRKLPFELVRSADELRFSRCWAALRVFRFDADFATLALRRGRARPGRTRHHGGY
jgi:hypothetical protein